MQCLGCLYTLLQRKFLENPRKNCEQFKKFISKNQKITSQNDANPNCFLNDRNFLEMGRIYKRTKRENICFAQKYRLENTRKNCGQFKNLFLEKIKIA